MACDHVAHHRSAPFLLPHRSISAWTSFSRSGRQVTNRMLLEAIIGDGQDDQQANGGENQDGCIAA